MRVLSNLATLAITGLFGTKLLEMYRQRVPHQYYIKAHTIQTGLFGLTKYTICYECNMSDPSPLPSLKIEDIVAQIEKETGYQMVITEVKKLH